MTNPQPPQKSQGWRSRGYLPHFDSDTVHQFITWHLGDSLPLDVAHRLATNTNDIEVRQLYEDYLDAGHGSCVLAIVACATIVDNALQHFDGQRYRLLAWVVMPNHVHALITMFPGHTLADIVHSWKRHTALSINRHQGTTGPLWRREYWDRFIRDENHFRTTVAYIEENPVKAGLVPTAQEWAWSSAAEPVENRRSQGKA